MTPEEERALLHRSLRMIDDGLGPIVAAGIVEPDAAAHFIRGLVRAACRRGHEVRDILPRTRKAVAVLTADAPSAPEVLG